ncbi:MAG TPA: helix-turn-helix domain-containing protein [Thermoplasmata archaeon]|nr:helix-turn-helix domain-containing protein [Thermoplasmata archaeon]
MEKGFWAIPKSIAKRRDLSYRAKLVSGILWTRKNSDFQAFPSRNYIAKALGVSTKTVDRGIRELKEKVGLKVERKGFGRNNRYYFPDWDEPEHPEVSLSDKTDVSTQDSSRVSSPIVRDNKKDNTFVEESSSPVKEIFHYFREVVGDIKGFDPEICWGRDGRLVKLRLKKYSLEEIKGLIDWYLTSEVSERLGVSLATCLSTHVINLWKENKTRKSHLDRLYPIWQMRK